MSERNAVLTDYSEWPKSEVAAELRDASESVAFLRDRLADAETDYQEQFRRSREVYGSINDWPASSRKTLDGLNEALKQVRDDLSRAKEYRDRLNEELWLRETGVAP